MHGWRKAEQQPREQRRARAEEHDRPVESDLGAPRQRRRGELQHEVEQPQRQQPSERPAGERKEQALDELLADDARRAGAERAADGDVTFARGRTRELQVRDVRAADEQHEHDRRHHDEERRAGRRDQVLLQRVHRRHPSHALRVVRRVELSQARAERVHAPARFIEADAGLQQADRGGKESRGVRRRRQRRRDPSARRPDLGLGFECHARMTECRLGDADDRVRVVVDAQRLAKHGAVGAERASPEAVADHDDGRDAGRVVLGAEETADLRARAKQLKVGRAREHGFDALRLGPASQVRRDRPDPHHVVEQTGAIAVVHQLRRREARVLQVDAPEVRADADEPIGVRVGQRAEDDGFDDREDGRRGGDADREREQRNQREAGRQAQPADCHPDIAELEHRHLRVSPRCASLVPAARNRAGPRMSSVSQRVRTGVSAHGTPRVRYRTAQVDRVRCHADRGLKRNHRFHRFHRFLSDRSLQSSRACLTDAASSKLDHGVIPKNLCHLWNLWFARDAARRSPRLRGIFASDRPRRPGCRFRSTPRYPSVGSISACSCPHDSQEQPPTQGRKAGRRRSGDGRRRVRRLRRTSPGFGTGVCVQGRIAAIATSCSTGSCRHTKPSSATAASSERRRL